MCTIFFPVITKVNMNSTIPDSKWKLGQHWVLSCNFRWANVGCAMQNHPHFAHPKNVGPTCCTNVGPTCCTTCWPNMLYKRWPNMLYKRWPNMLYKRWPNMMYKRWLSVSKWKLLTMFFFLISFSQWFTCYSPCDLSVFLDRRSLIYNSDSKKSSK